MLSGARRCDLGKHVGAGEFCGPAAVQPWVTKRTAMAGAAGRAMSMVSFLLFPSLSRPWCLIRRRIGPPKIRSKREETIDVVVLAAARARQWRAQPSGYIGRSSALHGAVDWIGQASLYGLLFLCSSPTLDVLETITLHP
jgi:hypothetical protein